MPVVGLPTTLETVLNILISQPGLSSFKIAANPGNTTVVLRFPNMADGQSLATGSELSEPAFWRKKSASQRRRDLARLDDYWNTPRHPSSPHLTSTFRGYENSRPSQPVRERETGSQGQADSGVCSFSQPQQTSSDPVDDTPGCVSGEVHPCKKRPTKKTDTENFDSELLSPSTACDEPPVVSINTPAADSTSIEHDGDTASTLSSGESICNFEDPPTADLNTHHDEKQKTKPRGDTPDDVNTQYGDLKKTASKLFSCHKDVIEYTRALPHEKKTRLRDKQRNGSLKRVLDCADGEGRLLVETDDTVFVYDPDESKGMHYWTLHNEDEKESHEEIKERNFPELCVQDDPQAFVQLRTFTGDLMCFIRRCLEEETTDV